MVGEVSKDVEGEGISGIFYGVVVGDKGEIVLEYAISVEFLFLGGIGLAMLLAPGLENIGIGGRER